MFCENCGKNLPDKAKFCNGCGAKIASAQAVANGAEQPATNTPPPPVYIPPTQSAPPPPTRPVHTPADNHSYFPQPEREPLRVIQYIGIFLLTSIPLVGFILLFVWGFGSSVNLNKKNFARAMLILSAIGFVLSIIFGAVIISIISELIKNIGGNTGGYGYY